MADWSLARMLEQLHADIQHRLAGVRATLGHNTTMGDGSEAVWLELLGKYLPERYSVARAHVIDSKDEISEQIDIVVFDRQYTPFIFVIEDQKVIPAESVYAVFEAKQEANATNVKAAQKKAATVRRLHRTSLPIPHAGGTFAAKPPIKILAGLLTLDSGWSPPLGETAKAALDAEVGNGVLDIGCVAAHGHFVRKDGSYVFKTENKPATAFLFALISALQFSGTVPMIDVEAYAKWLES